MHARTCLRFGEISSLLVAFLMLMASSWSVLIDRAGQRQFRYAPAAQELQQPVVVGTRTWYVQNFEGRSWRAISTAARLRLGQR